MAKPRVFISSTYYDLKHIRKGLESFVNQLGYEPILFESGDIPFHHDEPLDISCYKEVEQSSIFVLIIGGRYGSAESDDKKQDRKKQKLKLLKQYNSITKKEFDTAQKNDVPTYIFIEKNVAAEYNTFKKNKGNSEIKYVSVDNPLIFNLIESIYSKQRNNLCKEFENIDDITNWLRDQWAGLFSNFLKNNSQNKSIKSLESQITALTATTNGLKTYSESLIRNANLINSEDLIQETNKNIIQNSINYHLKSVFIFLHLIEDHSYSPDKIIIILKKCRSLKELNTLLEEHLPKDQKCGFIHNLEKSDLKQINTLRKEIFGFTDKIKFQKK